MLETLDYKIPMTTKAPLRVISVRGAGRGVGTQVIVRRGHRSLLPGTGGRWGEREDRDINRHTDTGVRSQYLGNLE